MDDSRRQPTLIPPPYLRALRDYLRDQEPEVWNWFRSSESPQNGAREIRLELLKSTYRIDTESEPAAYSAAQAAADALGLEVPVTLYQSQSESSSTLNASLAYVPGEAHLILQGPVLKRLSDDELRAVWGHELSHYALRQMEDGEYFTAERMLDAMCLDQDASPPHHASARRFRLYVELHCDRGAMQVCGQRDTAVAALVKMATGLEQVNPQSYLRQAEEIIEQDRSSSEQQTHPESYIRTRALQLWDASQSEAEPQIAEMIEGPLRLAELDLLQQQRVAALTRRMIDVLLTPAWFQTPAVLAHARLYFPDYKPSEAGADETLPDDIACRDNDLQQYYCYVLLDFITADRSLEEYPLAAALQLARQLHLAEALEKLAVKELRLRKRQLARIVESIESLLQQAEKAGL